MVPYFNGRNRAGERPAGIPVQIRTEPPARKRKISHNPAGRRLAYEQWWPMWFNLTRDWIFCTLRLPGRMVPQRVYLARFLAALRGGSTKGSAPGFHTRNSAGSSPACRTISLKTYSAIGLRQIFPWQTNIILVIKHPRSQVVLYHTK